MFKATNTADGGEESAVRSFFRDQFISHIANPAFPCLGAKAAVNAGTYVLSVFEELGNPGCSQELARELEDFTASEMMLTKEYATFVAIFRTPRESAENAFERLLWNQLQQLHDIDAAKHRWDPAVSSDPSEANFSFSLGGVALYVVGMHPSSSRLSRQFPWPALIFNPHAQFQRLRDGGKWDRMRDSIRTQDIKLQGNSNPMLSDFGETSEARQYSGRKVDGGWRPPFEAQAPKSPRCPFASMHEK